MEHNENRHRSDGVWTPPWREPTGLDAFGFKLLRFVKGVFGLRRPFELVSYQGFQTPSGSFVLGRVSEELQESTKEHRSSNPIKLALYMVKRFSRARAPKAEIEVVFGSGKTATLQSGGSGYFSLHTEGSDVPRSFSLKNVLPGEEKKQDLVATSYSRISDDTPLVVVSDIDDTIIESSAFDFLRSIKVGLFTALENREAVSGMSDFYQNLHDCIRPAFPDKSDPQFCYLTSSSWSLYEFLHTVLSLQGFPSGPLLMQSLGLSQNKLFSVQKHDHKLRKIRMLMQLCPDVQFLFVGDSGQHDVDIYRKILEEFPKQVFGILIREVDGGPEKNLNKEEVVYFRDGIDLTTKFKEYVTKWIKIRGVGNVE